MNDKELALLLSEGLDLCVRAKKLDGQQEEAFRQAEMRQPYETKCITPALWVQEHYDKDLEAWEERAKNALIKRGYIR